MEKGKENMDEALETRGKALKAARREAEHPWESRDRTGKIAREYGNGREGGLMNEATSQRTPRRLRDVVEMAGSVGEKCGLRRDRRGLEG